MTDLRVECYSGYRADERPVRFHLGGRWLEVMEVEDRWYSPGTTFFRVRAEDGHLYVLRHDEGIDSWTLDGFRSSAATGTSSERADTSRSVDPRRLS